MPHSIRLREPWKRVDDKSGGWTFSRTFNCPTGIERGQRIELHIRPVENLRPTSLQLNEIDIALTARDELFIADMADRLQPQNRLQLRLESKPPVGDVAHGQQSLASGSDSPAPPRANVESVRPRASSSPPDLTQLADVRILLF